MGGAVTIPNDVDSNHPMTSGNAAGNLRMGEATARQYSAMNPEEKVVTRESYDETDWQ